MVRGPLARIPRGAAPGGGAADGPFAHRKAPLPRVPTLGEIAAAIGGELTGGAEVRGDATIQIDSLAPIEVAAAGQITHLSSPAYRRFLAATEASAVLLRETDAADCPTTAVVVANPYLAFALVSQLFDDAPRMASGIHATAEVHVNARVHPTAAVGAGARIAAEAAIGANAQIGPNAFVGEGTAIGAGSVVHANATLYHNVRIGERCVIHGGAVIGADGFGFTPNESGELVAIAQLGGVALGNDVVVGACSTIDRGAITDTIVRDGVKIDNQVQIGHNCDIGEHTLICGAVGLAGSTKIGRHCALAGGAGVAGDGPVTICDYVQVGVVTTVTRSITEPGVYSGGVLHNTNRLWRRNALRFNQLDDLARRIARLERGAGQKR